MYSQVLRFTLPWLQTLRSSQEFRALREATVKLCSSQYYGYTMPTRSSPLPRRDEEVCWTIHWNDATSHVKRAEILSKLAAISATPPTSLLLQFQPGKVSELVKAFDASVSEFAMCNYSATTPFDDLAFQKSSEKTYTDCYLMRGFVGGQWSFALDGNDTNGAETSQGGEDGDDGPMEHGVVILKHEDRRLAVYCLGWESTELHQAATKTPLFAEEIDKLAPYFAPGTGAFYVQFIKHGHE